MNTESQLEQIEVNIEEARRVRELRNAADRLHENEDFKKVILEGFFKEDAARVVGMLATAEAAQNKVIKEMLQNRIVGIGELFQYLRQIHYMGQQADQTLADDEQTREEILAENLSE